jgi:hypothetical protein
MNWAGHPEPVDEMWILSKIVNQLKRISKDSIGYKFKLMPHEIIWHNSNENNKYTVTQMMQVPDCIALDMFEEAKACVRRNFRGKVIPKTKFITTNPVLCVQKLHVGPYSNSLVTLKEIHDFVEDQGYKVMGDRREIYLTPAMADCYPPETWKTIVRVEVKRRS